MNLFYNLHFLILIACYSTCFELSAQQSDQAFYLVDSIDLKSLDHHEKKLIDTTLALFHAEKSDTVKISYLNQLIESSKNDEVWPRYNQLMFKLASLKLQNKDLSKAEKLFFNKAIGDALNNIGFDNFHKGHIEKALIYYQKSLSLREKINDKKGISNSYNNLGLIYAYQDQNKRALKYFLKSMKLMKELKSDRGIAKAHIKIGSIYEKQGLLEEAKEQYLKSLKIRTSLNYENGMAQSLSYLGDVYQSQKKYKLAFENYQQSLDIDLKIGEKNGSSIAYFKLGKLKLTLNQLNAAEKYAKQSLEIAQDIGYPRNIKDAAELLKDIYSKKSQWKDAYSMFDLFVKMKDSIINDQTKKASLQQEVKYQYDKKKLADSINFAKKETIKNFQIKEQKATIEAEKSGKYILFGGLGFLLILLGLSLYSIINKQRANKEIARQKKQVEIQRSEANKQKETVEKKNEEITASIQYAKRIQNAILPSNQVVNDLLKNSFIFYKPKDIVAGDFYWLEQKKGKILFAAADCTGHGVPGAMVSVVCNNALNRSVREHGLTEPGKVLDKTREIVIQEFQKSNEEVKDGMDIALCSLIGTHLEYSGAHNPLWIVRNGQLIETKANKQPIGKFDKALPFTTHKFELKQGDTIYLFSDGYSDQFGGQFGKKFKAKSFKNLLLEIQHLNMLDQKNRIEEVFNTWKGSIEQLDDVCVIGLRV